MNDPNNEYLTMEKLDSLGMLDFFADELIEKLLCILNNKISIEEVIGEVNKMMEDCKKHRDGGLLNV